MSIRIMSQCWLVKLPTPAHKIILLKFADHANDDGLAYPGAIGISEAVGLAERQTRKLIGELRTWGFLKVFEAEDPVKGKPITYQVTPALGRTPALQCTPKEKQTKTKPTPALQCSPVVEYTTLPPLHYSTPPPCTTAPLPPALQCTQTIIEPSINHHTGASHETNLGLPTPHPSQQPGQPDATPSPDTIVMFEALFAIWPAKKKKPQARQAYTIARNRGVAHETMTAGARRFAKYHAEQKTKEQFLQSLDDWINSDGWTSTNGKRESRKPMI